MQLLDLGHPLTARFCREACQILGIEIADDAIPIQQHPFRGPTAFMLGNEVGPNSLSVSCLMLAMHGKLVSLLLCFPCHPQLILGIQRLRWVPCHAWPAMQAMLSSCTGGSHRPIWPSSVTAGLYIFVMRGPFEVAPIAKHVSSDSPMLWHLLLLNCMPEEVIPALSCHARQKITCNHCMCQGTGLSDRQMRCCDGLIYIPQHGQATASLNVTVAASIVLHHFALWAGMPETSRDGAKYIVGPRPQRTGARGD